MAKKNTEKTVTHIPNTNVKKGNYSAEESAQRLLTSCWHASPGNKEVTIFPVDSVQIAKKLDLHVISFAHYIEGIGSDVSSFLVPNKDEQPTIWLRNSESDNRKRLNVAYLLGYFMIQLNEGLLNEDFYYEIKRGQTFSTPDEIFVKDFALELLMPKQIFKVKAGENLNPTTQEPDPIHLAQYFQVSLEAVLMRIKLLSATAK